MKILIANVVLRVAILSVIGTAIAPAASRAEVKMTEFFVGQQPGQMYVQRWVDQDRAGAKPVPLFLIHGGAHTGTAFTTTPSGQPGWAPQLAARNWDVYVVDWPGTGRSGVFPGNIDQGVDAVIDALVVLLDRTGPAVLVGHSIGGALSIKVSERVPNSVRALVALAPASVELPNPAVPAVPLGKPSIVAKEDARRRFANSEHFPKNSFENYYASIVALSPKIRNSAVGLTDELKLDRSKVDTWKKMPVLFLVAEEDRTVPRALTDETAKVMNVKQTALGADWGLTGHGHMFILENGHHKIAERIHQWLESNSIRKQ